LLLWQDPSLTLRALTFSPRLQDPSLTPRSPPATHPTAQNQVDTTDLRV
jgi:hypothetical protein